MVKSDALDAAKFGENFQDLFLFFGREHILTVMHAIVGAISTTEQRMDPPASLSQLFYWHVVIDSREAPCHLHQFLLSETPTLAVLPSCRKDCRAIVSLFGHQQPGLIMHAPVFIPTLTIETQGIPPRYVFHFQFFFFHIRMFLFFVAKIHIIF